jgi:hypothetical protein
VACHETNYSLEWNPHAPAALEARVDQKEIYIVRRNGALTGVEREGCCVIRFGRRLLHDGEMDSGTFAKATQLFGNKGAMGSGGSDKHVGRQRLLRHRGRRTYATGAVGSREPSSSVVSRAHELLSSSRGEQA